MGQSQLLILILGTLVVGLAVYTGVQLVHSNSQGTDEELIKQQMNVIITEARKYSLKLVSLGGGGGSFLGYQIPNNLANTNHVHVLSYNTQDKIIILDVAGTVTGYNGTSPVRIMGTYSSTTGNWQTLSRVN